MAKACEKFNLCRSKQWKPDGDKANVVWATERESRLLERQESLRKMWQGSCLYLPGNPYAKYYHYNITHCHAFTTIPVCSEVVHTHWLVVGIYESQWGVERDRKAWQCVCSGNTGHRDSQVARNSILASFFWGIPVPQVVDFLTL